MYCPSCGSNNQDGVKFCTRCGTNLGVVSDALKGRTTGALETDERTVKLLKDYYRSRRMMIIGGAGSALALIKLAGPFLLGFPDKLIPIVILSLGFLFLSLIAFVWGLVNWNNSSSEIKALGFSPSKGETLAPAPELLRLPGDQSGIGGQPYADDPIAPPNSVTERTTHLLDEDDQTPAIRTRSERK
ncbi:MAG TPA: zinc-ribbon domain-containing protein [Blastocatellia bacterium]|nr:zinc-ribbon domain-containing protein [Blastocatellia bacterium]